MENLQPETNTESLDLVGLEEYLEKNLPEKKMKAIKEMAYKIGKVGMSLDEACILSRVSKSKFQEWCEEFPQIADLMKIHALSYKYELMKITSEQATTGKDIKLATWLLEKQFAEDYDSTTKKEMIKFKQKSSDDIVSIAIDFVRKGNRDSMPVDDKIGEPKVEVIHDADFTELDFIKAGVTEALTSGEDKE